MGEFDFDDSSTAATNASFQGRSAPERELSVVWFLSVGRERGREGERAKRKQLLRERMGTCSLPEVEGGCVGYLFINGS